MPGSRKIKSSHYDGRPFGKSSDLPDIRLDEIKVIGSLYLLKPLLERIGIREAVDRVIPMQRDVGGLTHGQIIEQLIINRLDAPCPLVDIEYWAHERCIEAVYDIPSSKLNDDRIGRALDAASEYCADIEDIIVMNALAHFGIDPQRVLPWGNGADQVFSSTALIDDVARICSASVHKSNCTSAKAI